MPSVPKIAVIVVKNAKETNSQNIVFKSKKQRLDVSVPSDEFELAEKEFQERGVAESEFQYEDCGYYEDEPTEEGLCDSLWKYSESVGQKNGTIVQIACTIFTT